MNIKISEQKKIMKYFDSIPSIREKFIHLEESGMVSPDSATHSNAEPISEDASCSESESSYDEYDDYSETSPESESVELMETNDPGEVLLEDPTSIFTEALQEQLFLTNSKPEVNSGITAFLNWLMCSTDELEITHVIHENPIKLWTLLRTKSEWKVLSEFALRSFSIVASESGVERLFSQHKLVVNHLRRRTSKDLRISRLQLKLL